MEGRRYSVVDDNSEIKHVSLGEILLLHGATGRCRWESIPPSAAGVSGDVCPFSPARSSAGDSTPTMPRSTSNKEKDDDADRILLYMNHSGQHIVACTAEWLSTNNGKHWYSS